MVSNRGKDSLVLFGRERSSKARMPRE